MERWRRTFMSTYEMEARCKWTYQEFGGEHECSFWMNGEGRMRGMEEKFKERKEKKRIERTSYRVILLFVLTVDWYFLLRVFLRYIRMGFTSDNPYNTADSGSRELVETLFQRYGRQSSITRFYPRDSITFHEFLFARSFFFFYLNFSFQENDCALLK